MRKEDGKESTYYAEDRSVVKHNFAILIVLLLERPSNHFLCF